MKLFETRLRSHALQTEQALERLLPDGENDYAAALAQAMRYSVLGGGKRLRAHLVLEFCELCGADPEIALPYAAGLECMHAFSLIHDDLPCMDNDTLRRGKPTNHVVYGESTALLAGDALSLHACFLIASNKHTSPLQNVEATRLLTENAGFSGMCGGQQIDLQGEHKQLTRDELKQLVDRKTGALFACACGLGCIAAGATDEQKRSADRFARLTGLAFQITDDLLDLHATAEQLGKTPGKDVQTEKSTFPALLGEEEAASLAKELCDRAKECLTSFPNGEAKQSLYAYCDYITVRTH